MEIKKSMLILFCTLFCNAAYSETLLNVLPATLPSGVAGPKEKEQITPAKTDNPKALETETVYTSSNPFKLLMAPVDFESKLSSTLNLDSSVPYDEIIAAMNNILSNLSNEEREATSDTYFQILDLGNRPELRKYNSRRHLIDEMTKYAKEQDTSAIESALGYNTLFVEVTRGIGTVKEFLRKGRVNARNQNRQRILNEIHLWVNSDLENIKKQALITQMKAQYLKMVTLPTPKGEESIDSFYQSIGMDRASMIDDFFKKATTGTLRDLETLERNLLDQVNKKTEAYYEELHQHYVDKVTNEEEFQKGKNRLKQLIRDLTLDVKYLSDKAFDIYNEVD